MDTVEDARDYVAGYPEVFGGMRVSGELVIVSFTADLDEHLRGLQASVEHPSLIRVEPAEHPLAELEADARAIRQRLGDDPRHPYLSSRPGHVRLRAPFEELAAQLQREYGAALTITLGLKPFPPQRIIDPQPVPLPTSTLTVPGLELTILLGAARVGQGEDLKGWVVFHNRGSHQLKGMTRATLAGGVRAEGEDHLAGNYAGAMTLAGRVIELDPGESTEVPILIGTASCLPDTSYVVPPGRYEIIAALGYRQPEAPPRPQPRLIARGSRITVETRTTDQ